VIAILIIGESFNVERNQESAKKAAKKPAKAARKVANQRLANAETGINRTASKAEPFAL
jgi:hypothetical protein